MRHLGFLEESEQGEVIVGLRILNRDLVKPETVNLGRQEVVVGLWRLEILVSIQLIRVSTAKMNRLRNGFPTT